MTGFRLIGSKKLSGPLDSHSFASGVARRVLVESPQLQSRACKSWGIIIAMILALGSVPLLLLSWVFFGHEVKNFVHQRTFNQEVWKTQNSFAHDADWPPRLCMVDDLLASGRLTGMSKGQVIDLLGPPDGTQDAGVSYYLGPERGLIRIDSETLMIEFGGNGKVSHQKIHRD